MATNFKYASISDLNKYFNRVNDFDSKVQIFPTLTSGNLHLFRDSGYVDTLFLNGEELAAAQSTSGAVDTNGEWFYASATNQVEYYNSNYSSTTINEQVFEAGVDFTSFLEQALVDASLELHNYLDMRYSTPLEKIKQVDSDTASVSIAEEYDPIIIKAVCYIATANLIRAKEGASEEADYYYSLVTNPESTGLIDKLNEGVFKLSHEVDANDKKGSIRYRNVSGTMDLVELSGEYRGELYDLLKVEVEDSGAYGTGTFKVHYLSNDQLFGATTSSEKITGGLQHIFNGLYGRFQGASATDGDIWEIEVFGSHRKQTNKSNATIELSR
jgi:phage gp36-like protein